MEKIVYGFAVADKVKSDVRNYIGMLKEEGKRLPHLEEKKGEAR